MSGGGIHMSIKKQFGSMGSFDCASPGNRTQVTRLSTNYFAKPSCWPIHWCLRLPQGWIRSSPTPDFLEKPLTKVRDSSPLMQTQTALERYRHDPPSAPTRDWPRLLELVFPKR